MVTENGPRWISSRETCRCGDPSKLRLVPELLEGFPGSSAGKESTCNAGDPGSIPVLGRRAGEGIGYPLQYSWASLVAHQVKNPPAVWETWIRSHSSILAWRIAWTV